MFLLESSERNSIGSVKKTFKAQPLVQGVDFGAASKDEVLSRVNPLFLGRLKEGRDSTAEDTGSFKEINPASFSGGGFCGSDSRQASADNA